MIPTEEQNAVRDMAARFARDEIAPHAATWDADRTFPRDLIGEMGALGFMGMLVPEAYDGAMSDHVSYALALEEIAAGSGAVSSIMSVHNSVGCVPILRYGTDAQKEEWLKPLAKGEKLAAFCLTEPHAGSDASAVKTRARRTNTGWVLDGVKQFITSGSNADVAIVFASSDPDAGKRGISAFVVPTKSDGYRVASVENKLGQHASDTAQIVFEDLELPETALLGEEGLGYRIALSNLEGGRIGIAAQAVGMARAALEAALDYARDRESMGARLIDHQAVGFRLADMATEVEAGRQMVLHAAALSDANQPALQAASMAKLYASEMAERVTSAAIQCLGGYGYTEDYPVGRIWRDVRVCQIYEGTSDVQRMVIARALDSSA